MKELKIWNGDGLDVVLSRDYRPRGIRDPSSITVFACAESRAALVRMIQAYRGGQCLRPGLERSIKDRWVEGHWGIHMEAITPEPGLWLQFPEDRVIVRVWPQCVPEASTEVAVPRRATVHASDGDALQTWNGTGHGVLQPLALERRGLSANSYVMVYAAAHSRADLMSMIELYTGWQPVDMEQRLRSDWWRGWDGAMGGVPSERGLWVQYGGHTATPERVWPPVKGEGLTSASNAPAAAVARTSSSQPQECQILDGKGMPTMEPKQGKS